MADFQYLFTVCINVRNEAVDCIMSVYFHPLMDFLMDLFKASRELTFLF